MTPYTQIHDETPNTQINDLQQNTELKNKKYLRSAKTEGMRI